MSNTQKLLPATTEDRQKALQVVLKNPAASVYYARTLIPAGEMDDCDLVQHFAYTRIFGDSHVKI
ncbi:hypothetical protein [Sphingobium sp. WCS2017Hpa-17]|uniref:hypothetical protein n=1 Tax=Sphingobium sp. WCS2017Hpa-17 TaxID=3073638 RepID=UPI00288BC441|nr:hypothetical protein [Sphingobium sp. WCS2017Hpa-17]